MRIASYGRASRFASNRPSRSMRQIRTAGSTCTVPRRRGTQGSHYTPLSTTMCRTAGSSPVGDSVVRSPVSFWTLARRRSTSGVSHTRQVCCQIAVSLSATISSSSMNRGSAICGPIGRREGDELAVVEDRQRAGEQVPPDGDLGAGVAARYLVVGARVRDDVGGGDLAGLGDDEAVGELGVGGGEPERAGVGLEAIAGRLTAQSLVRVPVVLVVEEVGQP